MDVGQGSASIACSKIVPPLVIDCGTTEQRGCDKVEQSEFKRKTIEFINSTVQDHIPPMMRGKSLGFIITHAHEDHLKA